MPLRVVQSSSCSVSPRNRKGTRERSRQADTQLSRAGLRNTHSLSPSISHLGCMPCEALRILPTELSVGDVELLGLGVAGGGWAH